MANTSSRNYPKPVSSNWVSADVSLLQQAFDAIDADIAALMLQMSGKAPSVHGHNMADIAGLSTALSNKADAGHSHALAELDDVSGAGAAPAFYVLYKTPTGWVPGTIGSVLVNALSLVAGDLLVVTGPGTLARLPKGTDGQVLKMVAGLPAWAAP